MVGTRISPWLLGQDWAFYCRPFRRLWFDSLQKATRAEFSASDLFWQHWTDEVAVFFFNRDYFFGRQGFRIIATQESESLAAKFDFLSALHRKLSSVALTLRPPPLSPSLCPNRSSLLLAAATRRRRRGEETRTLGLSFLLLLLLPLFC